MLRWPLASPNWGGKEAEGCEPTKQTWGSRCVPGRVCPACPYMDRDDTDCHARPRGESHGQRTRLAKPGNAVLGAGDRTESPESGRSARATCTDAHGPRVVGGIPRAKAKPRHSRSPTYRAHGGGITHKGLMTSPRRMHLLTFLNLANARPAVRFGTRVSESLDMELSGTPVLKRSSRA
jgi:hypothetical protein